MKRERSSSLLLMAFLAAVLLAACLPRVSSAGGREGPRPDIELVPVRLLEHPATTRAARSESCACPDSFDVLHYVLDIDVDHVAETLSGVASLTVQSGKDGLGSIRLDLHQLGVSAVLSDGSPLAYSQVGDTLWITFDAPLSNGDTSIVEVQYGGTPDHESDGFGGFWFKPVPPLDFSWGQGNGDPACMGSYWFPCVNQPCDKATSEVRVETSLRKTAIANGYLDTLIVDSAASRQEWCWKDDFPAAPCYIALSVAKYREVPDSVDSRIVSYALPGREDTVASTFRHASHMMEYFEDTFGPYPFPGEKFSYAEVSEGGAIEHQTCVFANKAWIDGDTLYDHVWAHELAHQWFGDLVTYGDWRDIWLSEGFATYSEALYYTHRWSPWAGEEIYHWLATVIFIDPYLASPTGKYSPIYDPDEIFSVVSYEKAAAVLHMLRYVMEDGPFFAALRTYLNDHAYGIAYTPDLQAACETHHGGDLSWFFDEWVYSPGHPVIDWAWSSVEETPGNHRVDIITRQVQTVGPLFTMPVEFLLQAAGGDTTVLAWMSAERDSFHFYLGEAPTGIVFDPDDWLVDEANEVVTGLPASVAPVRLAFESVRPNPFNPSTIVEYSVPLSGRVRLTIHDVRGRLVATLYDGPRESGTYSATWSGRGEGGIAVPSAVYFARLQSAGSTVSKKLVLIR